jgi:cysteine desulfurase/selenocysteine lyase
LIDSAQYISSGGIFFSKNNVDYSVFSAHKLGGPTGLGVICVKNSCLNFLKNYKVGGGSVKKIEFKGSILPEYIKNSKGFEPGILNLAGIFGLGGTLDFINEIGVVNIKEHLQDLVLYFYFNLKKIEEVKILNSKKNLEKGSILSFYFKSKNISENNFNIFLNNDFKEYIIALRVGQHCANLLHSRLNIKTSIRVSFAYYNTKKEIDIFIKALKEFINLNKN